MVTESGPCTSRIGHSWYDPSRDSDLFANGPGTLRIWNCIRCDAYAIYERETAEASS
jgi:hypothetical protein